MEPAAHDLNNAFVPEGTRIEACQRPDSDERVYKLTISGGDLVRAKLTPHDHALLADCGSANASVADKLLGLELLVRRIEESRRGR